MHAGMHQKFVWEIVNQELVIGCADRRLGELLRLPAEMRFNNDEQATWFAQGRIDMHIDELQAKEEPLRQARE